MISAETGKACFTSLCHGISGHLIDFHLGDYEGTVSLTGNHPANQLFGQALAVIPRCVDQRHPEEKAGTERVDFFGCRMSSLTDMPRVLPDRRDDGAVAELDRPLYSRSHTGSRIRCQRAG